MRMNLNKHTSAHILTLDKQREESAVKSRQKSRTSYKKNVINSDDIRSNEDDDDDSILF